MKKIYLLSAFTIWVMFGSLIGQSQTFTFLTESFDGGSGTTPPTGWAVEQVTGTDGEISFLTSGADPTCSPYDGTRLVEFNSHNAVAGNSTRLKTTTSFSTVGYVNISVDLRWYQDAGNPSYQDKVEIQWSTNGSSWNTANSYLRHNTPTGWQYKTQLLPYGAEEQPTLYIAFLFTSENGNNCHLDIIHVISQNPSNTWNQKADFGGISRWSAVGFSIDNKGYIGMGYSGSYERDFWEFDPILNTWTQKADFGGTARYRAVGFSIGTKGYIGTGMDGNFKKDFWEFDPLLNTWTQKADFGGTARFYAVGFSIGAKGYIGTGSDGSLKKDFWEFDPLLNTWTPKADFGGTARSSAVGFSIDTKGYIGMGGSGSLKKDFWEFNPLLNTWTQKADFGGTVLNYTVGFSIGAKGYIGTGNNAGNKKDFWEFDPLLNTWTQKADFGGTARANAVGFSIGTKGYLGTGSAPSSSKDIWEYTPDGFRIGLLAGNSFCAGSSVNIPFSISTPCNPGNVFTAQLSDSFGSFSSPVTIGTMTGTTSGTISGTIPGATNDGLKYRIRIASSNPSAVSIDNLIDLSINQSVPGAAGTISGPTILCSQNDAIYSTSNIPDAILYTWTIPTGYSENGSVSNSINVNSGSIPSSGDITVAGHNGCGDGISSTLTITNYNCGSNTWTQKADIGGTGRQGAIGFSIGVKGYIGTGVSSSGNGLKDFWEFDPLLNTWTQKADFGGSTRNFAVGFSIGAKGYIGTGQDISGNAPKDFWEFDPLLNTWTQKADFDGTGRQGAVGFPIGTKGYIGTGNDINGNSLKDFWEFDPLLNTWTQKTDFGGTARSLAVGFSIGAKGYIGTGIDSNNEKDFWEFDPLSDTWTQKADFVGTERYYAVGFSIGDKGYIGTGYDSYAEKDFWEFDPLLNTWTQRPDFGGTARERAVGFSIGAKGYIGTGFDETDSQNDFWEYMPDGFRVGLIEGNSFCAGSSVDIQFTISAPFHAGNIFTAQLSDPLGDFTSPVTIGTVTGVVPVTIAGVIPPSTQNGSKYRIRVVSSDPSGVSIDNLVDLSIHNSVPATPGSISGVLPGCTWHNSTYSISQIPDVDYYNWTLPTGTTSNGSIGNSIQVNYGASFTSGSLIVKGHNGCGDGGSSTFALSMMYCGDNWIEKSDFSGTAREGAVGFSIGAKGYIGTGEDGSYRKDFWEFDPLSDSWTQKADFGGTARNFAVGFSIGAKGYIGTGYDETYNIQQDFWEFDPLLNTWTQKADFGGTARETAVGFSIGTKGYIGTGNDDSQSTNPREDFWEFDPLLNSWTQKADFGGGVRSDAVGFSIGGKGYIGTGYDNISWIWKDFWEFDPLLNTWTQMADFGGTARENAVGFSIGDKGYIGTGLGWNCKKDFWEFDPSINSWIQKADFSGTARYPAVGFSIGDKGYIGTGSTDDYTLEKDFWEYIPDGFRVGLLESNSLCSGSSVIIPFTLNTPCNPGNVFTAQLSDSLGSFTVSIDIGSLNGTYSDTIHGTLPVIPTNGYKYRIRIQSSDPPDISVDNMYNLSIYQATSPGIVSGGTTISLGLLTDTLILSGNVGSILKWQKQLNGGGYADISATTGLIHYIETPTATGTWDYRTIIKNGACNTESSTPTSVVVVSGPIVRSWTGGIDEKWNTAGNWSPTGVPRPQEDVIIPVTAPNMPVVKLQGLSCNNILIQDGATLTINPGIVLTVNGNITTE